MVLQNLEPYIRDYLQKTWSEYWSTRYIEKEDKVECIWSGINSTKIEFTYDAENETLLFFSKEPQPAEDLADMLKYLNEKAYELFIELADTPSR